MLQQQKLISVLPKWAREKQANVVSSPRWYSFTRQKMSKSEKCAYVATRAQKVYILQSRKPAIKCKKEHQKDQNDMLPHKPATMVKKPGQATQKKVVKNRNCLNVNMQPQKPSYSDEQSKKPVTKYKHKYKKHQEQVICQDKQSQETEQIVCEGQERPSTQCQSTRCFKRFTRSDNIQCPVRPKYTDDKSCQFMWPLKPVSVVPNKQCMKIQERCNPTQGRGYRCNLNRWMIQVLKRCNLSVCRRSARRCNLLCSQWKSWVKMSQVQPKCKHRWET